MLVVRDHGLSLSRTVHGNAVVIIRLFHFAGGSGYSAEAVIFLLNPFLSDVNLVYSLGRRVDNVGAKGCLPDTESVLVNVLYELAALVNGDFGIPFCHFWMLLFLILF